jgi:hypothetical protein
MSYRFRASATGVKGSRMRDHSRTSRAGSIGCVAVARADSSLISSKLYLDGERIIGEVSLVDANQDLFYASGASRSITGELDIEAVTTAMIFDPHVQRHIDAARRSMQKANEAALHVLARRQKLANRRQEEPV